MKTHVDVWHVRTDALDRAAVAACARLLTPDEQLQHARFVFERHRHEYLVTRGLARAVLSTYLAKPPDALSFFRTPHGRPLLDDAMGVRFNLTNTVALVACAVTRGPEIGVDAEPLERADTILGVAGSVFTTGERDHLASLALSSRRRRAVELWTLKEAYIKARGLGMSLPVQRIEVVFDRSPWLRFYPPVEDVVGRWTLSTREVEGHLISTCVEHLGNAAEDVAVEVSLRCADLSLLLRSDST